MWFRMPDTHDMVTHYEQMRSFFHGLSSGLVYPRWEEDTNRGLGAPTNIFYPSGFYYLIAIAHLLASNWTLDLLLVTWCLMIASGLSLYVYARHVLSPAAAMIAMAAYIFFPYHLLDQYVRGAMPELTSFLWMPLILIFIDRLFQSRRTVEEDSIAAPPSRATAFEPIGRRPGGWPRALGNIAGLSLSYGAFLWCHPPTAYQFSLACVIVILLLTIFRKDGTGLILVGVAMTLGLAFSAAYLYPASQEQKLIHSEIVQEDWPYHETYVFSQADFIQESPGFYRTVNGIWWFNTAAIVVAAGALLFIDRRRRRPFNRKRMHLILWTSFGLFATFMMTALSAPLGRLLPRIEVGVFSWRMLAITTLAGALLLGGVIDKFIRSKEEGKTKAGSGWAVLGVATLIAGISFSLFGIVFPERKLVEFVPESEHTNDVMIPQSVSMEVDDLPRLQKAWLEHGSGSVSIDDWSPERRKVRAQLDRDDWLNLRAFDYPGWSAQVDGRAAKIRAHGDWRNIQVEVPAGSHQVTLDFLETPDRRLGDAVSIASLGLIALIALAGGVMKFRQRREEE